MAKNLLQILPTNPTQGFSKIYPACPSIPMILEDGHNVLALRTIIKRHLSPWLNTLCPGLSKSVKK